MAQKFPGNVVQLTPAQIQRIQNSGIPLYIDGSKGGHTFVPSDNGRTIICTNTPALTFPLGLGDGFQVPIMGAFTLSGSGQPGMAIVNGTPSTDATAAVTLRQTAPGVYAIAGGGGGGGGPASALTAPQVSALQADYAAGGKVTKAGLQFGSTEMSNPLSGTASASGQTFSMYRSVARKAAGIRLLLTNYGAIPPTGCLYGVATVTRSDRTVAAANYLPVTFGNGLYTDPVAAGLFKGTKDALTPEFALSDPVFVPEVARVDGGTGFIYEGRVYVPAGLNYFYSFGSNNPAFLAAGGEAWSCAIKTGEFASAANAAGFGTGGGNVGYNYALFDFIFDAAAPVYLVGSTGDSIDQGQFSADGRTNEVKLACDALTAAGVGYFKNIHYSRPAQPVATFGPATLLWLRQTRPNIFLYTVNSPNDGPPTAPRTAEELMWAAEVHKMCREIGCQLILANQVPWSAWTTGQDAAQQAVNVQIAALAAALGVPYLDKYGITRDTTSTPPLMKPGYYYTAGTASQNAHPVDAGYQAEANVLMPVLRTLAGL